MVKQQASLLPSIGSVPLYLLVWCQLFSQERPLVFQVAISYCYTAWSLFVPR